MKYRVTILMFAALLAAPAASANEASRWAPATENAFALDTTHGPDERMHERWLPRFELEWRHERVVDMLCGLGLIALALVDCTWAAADASGDVLVLPPRAPEYSGDSLDYQELGRRSIEARMQSI